MVKQATKYRPLTEQIIEQPEETWTERGLGRGLISISADGGRVTYQCGNEGGTYSDDYADPEEKVRASFFVELVEKYKYPPERVWVEKHVSDRRPDYPGDLVVYEDDGLKQPYILVETKPTDWEPEHRFNKAIEQAFENAHLVGGVKFVVVDCSTRRVVFDYANYPPGERKKNVVRDLPVAYGNVPEYSFIKGDPDWDLPAATFDDLTRRFQHCHDAIWQGGKLDPAQAFDEMSKLMFAKYWDELRYTKNGEAYRFQIGTKESKKVVADRVRKVYKHAREQKGDVFGEDLKIPGHVIYLVVEILEDISLKKTDLDAKGRAFETFLSDIFRGKMGQFFTKRELVTFMVNMLDPDWDDLIIDPACGSGGFLLYAWDHVHKRLVRDYAGDRDTIFRLDWEFSRKHIFGIEINDRIARIAMMDMVIHEDGSSNIVCDDALSPWDSFPQDKIGEERFSMCLTNPPFGAVVKHQVTLKQFELGSKQHRRASQKTEILFIERCLQLLKPGGKLGIVLPDGILTNSSLDYVRKFIEENARILAVVSLPQHAFVPAGAGVKASLLFLQRFTTQQKAQFDSTARKVRQEVEEEYKPVIARREKEIEQEVMAQRETVEADLHANAEWMAKIEQEVRSRAGGMVQATLEVEIEVQIEAKVQKRIDRELKRQLQQELRAYRREVKAEMKEETWQRIRERLNYPIFMAIAEHVGYDATDRPDKNDLFMVDEEGRIDETQGILGDYKHFLFEGQNYSGNDRPECMQREYRQIEGRLDPDFHSQEYMELEIQFEMTAHRRLAEIAVFSGETRNPEEQPDEEFVYVDINSINASLGIIDKPQILRGREAPSRARKTIRSGDILISTVRPYRNAVASVPTEFDDQICSTGFAVVRKARECDLQYLFTVLRLEETVKQMVRYSMGTAYPAITETDLRKIKIPFPSGEEERQSVVAMLQDARAERELKLREAQQAIERAKHRIRAVLFKGE